MMTAIGLVFGYALLGATWLIMKTEDKTQDWARKAAAYALIMVGVFIVFISLMIPSVKANIDYFWLHTSAFYLLIVFLLMMLSFFYMIWMDLKNKNAEIRPFILSFGIFIISYLIFGFTFYPWIIPFDFTIWQAAAAGPGLSLMLVGVVPLLPLILAYTGYCYYIFRGKTDHEHHY